MGLLGLFPLIATTLDEQGNNALILASKNGHMDVVRYLMNIPEVSAAVFHRNHYKRTAAHEAELAKHAEIAEYIWSQIP